MILGNSRLRVTIEEPGQRYLGTRFDRTSIVSSVVLDGQTEYLSQELAQADSRTDRGIGLACEFGIRTPIGHDDCPVGGWFPKIGLGFIRRENATPYDFFATAREFRLAETSWTEQTGPDSSSLVFRSVAPAIRGYAWTLERRWTLSGTSLSSTVSLHNQGNQALVSDEYCHNFFRPGPADRLGTQDLSLACSWPLSDQPTQVIDPHHALSFHPGLWRFTGPSDDDLYVPNLGVDQAARAWWELRVDGRPWVRETLSVPVSRCDLWGKTHVVAPELFAPFTILPGEFTNWTRRWDFFPLND
jgi:hypothetical protein